MTSPARVHNAVATVEPPAERYELKSPIAKLLRDPATMAVVGPLIPHGMSYDEVISAVYRANVENPEISECTPASIVGAVSRVIETQLVLGQTIYLVVTKENTAPPGQPKNYVKKLQAWTHYAGDVELVQRSGAARLVDAHEVYAGDFFDLELGENQRLVHRPERDPAKRGKLVGAYCIAYINQSGTLRKITYLPLADIEKVRKLSKSWNPEKVAECPYWYALKTVIRRNCKTLPKNPKLARVIAILDEQQIEDGVAEPYQEPAPLASATPMRALNPGAPTKADGDGVALATTAQKIRITELLERADVSDARRVEFATAAGPSTFTSDAAETMIADLEKLVPPTDDQPGLL